MSKFLLKTLDDIVNERKESRDATIKSMNCNIKKEICENEAISCGTQNNYLVFCRPMDIYGTNRLPTLPW